MIAAGGCYELIGRFSYIENYHPLNQETILKSQNSCSTMMEKI
ncbi:MAG: hypothetical protein ACOCN3_09245 [Roseburia inulinivorans]